MLAVFSQQALYPMATAVREPVLVVVETALAVEDSSPKSTEGRSCVARCGDKRRDGLGAVLDYRFERAR
ncbi:MAG: hypothetical protein GY906_21330 [bacterium]|nr:hypothetical protein [bacterium]